MLFLASCGSLSLQIELVLSLLFIIILLLVCYDVITDLGKVRLKLSQLFNKKLFDLIKLLFSLSEPTLKLLILDTLSIFKNHDLFH